MPAEIDSQADAGQRDEHSKAGRRRFTNDDWAEPTANQESEAERESDEPAYAADEYEHERGERIGQREEEVASWWMYPVLVAAGVAAGITGSVAGLASLASYPVLLGLGLSPVAANVANTVALVFGGVGSVSGSRVELAGQARSIRPLALATVGGGIMGGLLLMVAPAASSEYVVPWLIAGASGAILLPRRPRRARSLRSTRLLAVTAIIGVYGGYFGAASAKACAENCPRRSARANLPPEHGRTEDQHHNEAQ